jgi:hypothetical protein
MLSEYKYDLKYREGKFLVIEDSLSRSPNLLLVDLAQQLDVIELIRAQKEDPIFSRVINALHIKNDKAKVFQDLGLSLDKFVFNDDILYFLENKSKYPSRRLLRAALPVELHLNYLDHYHIHLGGHLSFSRFWEKISSSFFYPDFYEIVKNYIKKCDLCLRNTPKRSHNQELFPILPDEPFDIIQMDHIIVNVPSKSNQCKSCQQPGYSYILVVTDCFSKKVWFLPTRTLGAIEAFDQLHKYIFSSYRFPKFVGSDLGSAFDNDLSEILSKATNVKRRFTLPASKGASGQVENRNKVAEAIIRKFVDEYTQDNWYDFCWTASSQYNKSVHSVTGYTPDSLVHGFNPELNLIEFDQLSSRPTLREDYKRCIDNLKESWKIVKQAILEQANRMIADRNKLIGNRYVNFKAGDLVLLNRQHLDKNLSSKFASTKVGPFSIASVYDKVHANLQITPLVTQAFKFDEIEIYNGELKPFPPGKFTPLLNEIIPISIPPRILPVVECALQNKRNNNKYDIKSIVGKRVSHFWAPTQSYYYGTIIGYNSELTHNLIFYDEPGVPQIIESCDYHKAFLFKKNADAADKWRLLAPQREIVV